MRDYVRREAPSFASSRCLASDKSGERRTPRRVNVGWWQATFHCRASNGGANPSNVGSLPSRPLIFASKWLSSEVGIQTDGTTLNSPESGGKFGGYRVQSFLNELTPVPLSQGSMYVIKQSKPIYPALVYPMPTSHPCVNRLFLAAGDTTGFWPAPTYALGRYQLDNNGLPMRDKPLMTYLIVNICLDLGKTAVTNRQSVLRPNAMIILALHWPCEGPGCANNGIGHQH